MTLTIFLARTLGIFLFAVGLFWLTRRAEVEKGAKQIRENPAVRLVAGLLSLAVGLAIVVGYNVWTDWKIVISFLGIYALVLARYWLFRGEDKRMIRDWKGRTSTLTGLVSCGLGIFLFLMGFFFG